MAPVTPGSDRAARDRRFVCERNRYKCVHVCVCMSVCVWTVCTNFSSSCSTRRNLQRDDRWCNGSSQHPRRFFDPPLAEPGPFSRLFAAEREWNGPRAKSARDYRDESARTRLVRGGGGLN